MKYTQLTHFFKKGRGRIVSVDFGQAVTKIAYLESLNDTFKLISYDFQKIVAPDEKRKELVVDFINNFLKKNSVSSKDVVFSVSDSDSIIIKYLVLPSLPEGEILEAAKWQLKEETPFKLEDASVDWQVVREYTDKEGVIKRGIVFILAKKEIINKYLSIINSCNLTPVGITSSPFNYASIITFYPQETGNIAVLDIGYKDSTLCIYSNNKLNFIRKLAFSSEKLAQSLTGVLVSARGKVELSYEQAEDIKNTFGIPTDLSQTIKDNIQASQIVSLMRPILEMLVRDLNLSFEYFTLNFNTGRPSLLYVTGGSANLKNLNSYLSKELNIDVVKFPLPQCINAQTIDKERLNNDQGYIISALGAVFTYPRTINLLPEEIKAQKIELVEKVSLRVVSITTAAIFLFLLFMVKFQIRDYQNRLKTERAHLQTIAANAVLKQNVYAREQLINAILKNRIPVDGLLKLISSLIPGNIILDQLTLDSQGGQPTLILKGVVSTNKAIAESILAKFIEQLEASSFVSEARLVYLNIEGASYGFQIDCQLVH